jgi:hypothetical protein
VEENVAGKREIELGNTTPLASHTLKGNFKSLGI